MRGFGDAGMRGFGDLVIRVLRLGHPNNQIEIIHCPFAGYGSPEPFGEPTNEFVGSVSMIEIPNRFIGFNS